MSKRIAIAGVTGAVGTEVLECLESRNFPVSEIVPLASARSVGKKITYQGEEFEVQELGENSFEGVDIALFCASGAVSKELATHAAKAGAVVVDNSSAFRMDDDIPLVVPEINPQEVQNIPRNIIANPNCTTIITLMGLKPLHEEFGVKSVVASSYQAVSGSGNPGIEELENQVKAIAEGKTDFEKSVYPHQIAFNVIPQVETFTENGYTKEEMKLQNEGRKILGYPELKASITCVRVPVYRAHAIAVTASFEKEIDLDKAREVINKSDGVLVVDDLANNLYPTPLDATNGDDCLVGRIRKDLAFENGISFWVVGDQVRKGAALNAVQIAELL